MHEDDPIAGPAILDDVRRVLEQEGEHAARLTVARLWSGERRQVLDALPSPGGAVFLPVAVSSQLADRLGATSPLVRASALTLRNKLRAHRADRPPLRFEDIGRAQAILDVGEGRREDDRWIGVAAMENGWWQLVAELDRDGSGQLRLISIYSIGERRYLQKKVADGGSQPPHGL